MRAKIGFGLALLDGVVVDQNFSSWAGRLERMSDLLRHGPMLDRLDGVPGVGRRTIGLGVERHTALVLQGNTIRAIGEGRGHVFLKSNGDRVQVDVGRDEFDSLGLNHGDLVLLDVRNARVFLGDFSI